MDEGSSLQITFNNGCTIDASDSAQFKIEENFVEDDSSGESIIISQISGLLNTDFNNTGDGTVTINTPSIAAGVRGTKFVTIVGNDGSTYIGVTEGEVAVSSVLDEQNEVNESDYDFNDDVDSSIGNQMMLNKYETSVKANQQVEVSFGEIENFKPSQLDDLDKKKIEFIKEKKEEIINDFPKFAKQMIKSFTQVAKFHKETEKRFRILVKAAEGLKKVEEKIVNSKLPPKKKKEALDKILEKKKELLKDGMEFFKETHEHSHKIMAQFRLVKHLSKTLEGTDIVESDLYKELMEKYKKTEDVMKDYMDLFKEKAKRFREFLMEKPNN